MLEWIPQFFETYKYILFFIGMIFAGEAVLIPALYGTLVGVLNLPLVISLALIATALSDTIWYMLGRYLPKEKIFSFLPLRRRQHIFEHVENIFMQKGLMILLLSKFIYGTRIITQVLCGMHRMRYSRYFGVNLIGIALPLILMTTLLYLADLGVSKLGDVVYHIQITFLIFIIIATGLHMLLRILIGKKWFQR